jgi:hypothetical protein
MNRNSHDASAVSWHSRMGVLSALLAVLILGACESRQQVITQNEDRLAAAGFIVKPANTPERQAMLKKLPPNKFVMRTSGDNVHYVYADPIVCSCLYVGNQDAYNKYKSNELAEHLADEQQLTAETYQDAAWDWGAWGPWGPGFAYRRFGW